MIKRDAILSAFETAGVYVVAAALLVIGIFISPNFLTTDNLLEILKRRFCNGFFNSNSFKRILF